MTLGGFKHNRSIIPWPIYRFVRAEFKAHVSWRFDGDLLTPHSATQTVTGVEVEVV